jgi:hypothetical protein
MTVADRLEAFIAEHGAQPGGTLSVELGIRKSTVLAELHGNPDRFVHYGKRRASRWDVRKTSFDALEAAARWGCDPEMADEIIFGEEGFLERGFVASLNGNGRVVVTELGLSVAAMVEAAA